MTLAQATAPRPTTLPSRPIKPDVESWEAGGQRYASTADLVSRATLTADGLPATYSFQTAADLRDTRLDKVVGGAAVGAAVGAVAGGGIAFMGGVLRLLEQFAFHGSGSAVPVLGLVVGTAAVGAAIGAFAGTQTPVAETHQIHGTVRAEHQADGSTKPVFYQGDDLNRKVDLAAYAQAQAAPAATVADVPWWKDSLVGAGAGAAASGLAIFGFGIGQLGVVAGGAHLGRGLAGGRTWGTALGATAGFGAVAGTIAAGQVAGFPGILATGAGLAVTGALVGPLVGPRVRATEADAARYGSQWWNQQPS